MTATDSVLVAAFRAALAKGRELEADAVKAGFYRQISFRLYEAGISVRAEELLSSQDSPPGEAVSRVRTAEQFVPWIDIELRADGPESVLSDALAAAVSSAETNR